MKETLPEGHALPGALIAELPEEDGKRQITDAQYAALEAGLAKSESLLVVSPTSTGKTLIGTWAMRIALDNGVQSVYLVTHRALAEQKFAEVHSDLKRSGLELIDESIVVATGDRVVDGTGNAVAAPLDAAVLIATYEKFLGLLASNNDKHELSGAVYICDEIQLLGEGNRGRNTEILLTLLKSRGWSQLIGLSAVLSVADARRLSDWLGVKFIRIPQREKELTFELHTSQSVSCASTSSTEVTTRPRVNGEEPDTLALLQHFLTQGRGPVIVFCPHKKDTYQLAEQYGELVNKKTKGQLPFDFNALPPTSAKSLLRSCLPLRYAPSWRKRPSP